MKDISYLSISDVHIGHPETSAEEIVEHLDDYFKGFGSDCPFNHIDMVFIVGDLWDDSIDFASKTLGAFLPWFDRFLAWAHRREILVFILEGTPRHDRRQSATLMSIISDSPHGSICKYIPSLCIQRIEEHDLTVLYVPDKCRPTAEAVARDVQALFDEQGVEQVDIGMMHGMFKYQLGTIPMNNQVHEERFYLDKVKNFISIGHVHTYSTYERIVAQGSFDRLTHGQEEPKGAVLFTRVDGEWSYRFVENVKAKKYVDLEVKGNLDTMVKKIDKLTDQIPRGSSIRLVGDPLHPLFQGFSTLSVKYPFHTFKTKKLKKDEKKVSELELGSDDYKPVVLNRQTVTQAIYEEVSLNADLSIEESKRLFELLESNHLNEK